MLAAGIRSGLVETIHEGAVAVLDADGALIAQSGDIDRPFYLRSAAKPFQAAVARAAGADLSPIQLAVAAASHDGDPAHIAIVRSMLDSSGLSVDDLRCPAGWPLGDMARQRALKAGHREARPIWHNCSGKHASWLRASHARDWPLTTYLDPRHPLQQEIVAFVSDLGGRRASPVGVDGCGAPVLRTTARAMGLLFARLATVSELRPVFQAMHRYPALASGVGNGDAAIATALHAAAKRGAQGCLGVALAGGIGIGVKAWDGLGSAAEVGAIAALGALGFLPPAAERLLKPFSRPPVRGGGGVVGEVEPRLELQMA